MDLFSIYKDEEEDDINGNDNTIEITINTTKKRDRTDEDTTIIELSHINNNNSNSEKRLKIGIDKCEICRENLSKYKCPACLVLFCSMQCSSTHRSESDCNGVKKVNHFIPLNKMTDNDIINDFNFLDNINRVNDSGKKILSKSFIQSKSIYIQRAAFRREINLMIMPKEMSRHKENSTHYNKKKNILYWRIQFSFESDSISLYSQSVNENDILQDVILKHINEPTNRYNIKRFLKQYQQTNNNNSNNENNNDFYLLFKRERSSQNQYFLLNRFDSVNNNLMFKEIIEFPTILVVLDISKYNIIKDEELEKLQEQQKEIISNNLHSKFDPNLVNTYEESQQLLSNGKPKKFNKKQQQSKDSQKQQESTTKQDNKEEEEEAEVEKDEEDEDSNEQLTDSEKRTETTTTTTTITNTIPNIAPPIESNKLNEQKESTKDEEESEFFFTF